MRKLEVIMGILVLVGIITGVSLYVVNISGSQRGKFIMAYDLLSKPLLNNVTLYNYMDDYFNVTGDIPVLLNVKSTLLVNGVETKKIFINSYSVYGVEVSPGDEVTVILNLTNLDDKVTFAIPYISVESPEDYLERGIDVYNYRWGVADIYMPAIIELSGSPQLIKVDAGASVVVKLVFKISRTVKSGDYLINIGISQLYNIEGKYFLLRERAIPLALRIKG